MVQEGQEELERKKKEAEAEKNELEKEISIYKILLEQAKAVIENLQHAKEQNEEEISSKKGELVKVHEEVELLKK